jgi:hypothetical protein
VNTNTFLPVTSSKSGGCFHSETKKEETPSLFYLKKYTIVQSFYSHRDFQYSARRVARVGGSIFFSTFVRFYSYCKKGISFSTKGSNAYQKAKTQGVHSSLSPL